jgi:hypothetical protein
MFLSDRDTLGACGNIWSGAAGGITTMLRDTATLNGTGIFECAKNLSRIFGEDVHVLLALSPSQHHVVIYNHL